MRLHLAVLVATAAIGYAVAQGVIRNPPRANPVQTNDVDLVSDSVTNLAQKIARAIANPRSKTEIFSPVSIAGALSLLLLGSGGQTMNELMRVMGFDNQPISFQDIHKGFGRLFKDLVSNDPSLKPLVAWRSNDKCNHFDEDEDEDYPEPPAANPNESPEHIITVANGIFLANDLQLANRYYNLSKTIYQAEVTNMNFANDPTGSAAAINAWCSRATRGKISQIVSDRLVANARMVLTSALYFKATWETTFNPLATRKRPFYPNGYLDGAIEVDMMGTDGCFPFHNDTGELNVQIVGLPYVLGKSTMYAILPHDSNRERLQQVQQQLDARRINRLIDQMTRRTGIVLFPKLAISNSMNVKDALLRLGVYDMFDPRRSDLNRILNNAEYPEIDGSVDSQVPLVTNVASRFTPDEIVPQQPTATTMRPRPNIPVRVLNGERECNLVANCQFTPRANCTCFIDQRYPKPAVACNNKVLIYSENRSGLNCFKTIDSVRPPTYFCQSPAYDRVDQYYGKQFECESFGFTYFHPACYRCKVFRRPSGPTPQQTNLPPQSAQRPNVAQPNQTPVAPILPSLSNGGANTFQVRNDVAPTPSPPKPPQQPVRVLCKLIDWKLYRCPQLIWYDGKPMCVDCYSETRRVRRQLPPAVPEAAPEPLYVDQIIHEVKLDVNEKGTEGGAVTAAVTDRISPSISVRFDSPFLLYIRNDDTKLPLFYGMVYDPTG